MTRRRCLIGIRVAFVEVGLTIFVDVDQPRQLIATEHEDPVLTYSEAERMMQAGCESTPRCRLWPGRRIAALALGMADARHMPHITLHRGHQCRTIGQEVMVATIDQCFPGIVPRQLHRIDCIGSGVTQSNLRRDLYIPLRWWARQLLLH